MKMFMAIILFAGLAAFGKSARVIYMTDTKMERILIPVGKTLILSFPDKPAKVILGNQGLFGVSYVESDLAVSPLKVGAESNMFVYLDGKRFGFDLMASSQNSGDEIVLVRDAAERRLKVRVRHE